MIFRRVLLQTVLAALLLVAQHVALTHQVWHLHDGKSAPVEQQNNGKKAAHSALCEFHVAFAEVLGAVGCDHAPLKVANNTVELSVNHSPPGFSRQSSRPRFARPARTPLTHLRGNC